MPQEKNPTRSLVESDATIAALLASQAPKGSAAEDGTQDILKQLLAAMSNRMEREEAADRAKEDELRRLLTARNEDFKVQIARLKAIREACRHVKENGRPCIGGQKLSNNHYLFLCLHCYSEWSEADLPGHLTVNMDEVGG